MDVVLLILYSILLLCPLPGFRLEDQDYWSWWSIIERLRVERHPNTCFDVLGRVWVSTLGCTYKF